LWPARQLCQAAIAATTVLPLPTSPINKRFIATFFPKSLVISLTARFWALVKLNGRSVGMSCFLSTLMLGAKWLDCHCSLSFFALLIRKIISSRANCSLAWIISWVFSGKCRAWKKSLAFEKVEGYWLLVCFLLARLLFVGLLLAYLQQFFLEDWDDQ